MADSELLRQLVPWLDTIDRFAELQGRYDLSCSEMQEDILRMADRLDELDRIKKAIRSADMLLRVAEWEEELGYNNTAKWLREIAEAVA